MPKRREKEAGGNGVKMGETYLLYIPGRLPGINEYTDAQRANKHKGAKLKHDAQSAVSACIRQQLKGLHLTRPVRLEYTFVEPNKRRDLDNISGMAHKVIQDALVQTGVLPNDGWQNIRGYADDFRVDANDPHIKVQIIVQGGE